MVEDNESTYQGTRFVRTLPGERTPEEVVETRPTLEGEPQAPVEGDNGTYHGAGFNGRIPGRSGPTVADEPSPAPGPRTTPQASEKPRMVQAAPAHAPASVLAKGTWKYLGGVPGWHHWNSLEKESEYVLSPSVLHLTRGGSGVSIRLEAIEGVALDCRWSRPRFLMMFATSDGESHLATFEFGQRFRAAKAAERFLFKLLELGVRPDESVADSAGDADQSQGLREAANPNPQAQSGMTQQHSNWMTDPLAVYRPNADPMLVRIQGFFAGLMLGIFGLASVALLSSPEKRGDRVTGSLIGLVVWFAVMYLLGAFDPWLLQYGLNYHTCFYNISTGEIITCDGPLSPL